MIQFNELPESRRSPGFNFEFNTEAARRGVPGNHQKVLIIGQKLSSGSLAELTPYPVYSEAEAALYAGHGSIGHLMTRALIKAAAKLNPNLDITLILIDDADAGVAATGTLTFTGPATAPGVLTLYVASQKIEIAISTSDTAAQIAAALVTEMGTTKHPDLPVTAASWSPRGGQVRH